MSSSTVFKSQCKEVGLKGAVGNNYGDLLTEMEFNTYYESLRFYYFKFLPFYLHVHKGLTGRTPLASPY